MAEAFSFKNQRLSDQQTLSASLLPYRDRESLVFLTRRYGWQIIIERTSRPFCLGRGRLGLALGQWLLFVRHLLVPLVEGAGDVLLAGFAGKS